MKEGYSIKSRIWIETEEGMFLGFGRVKLLRAIETEGSVSKAAKKLKMSYKKAWNLVDSMNRVAEREVVTTSVGGRNGGGTRVTDYGRELVQAFEKINRETIEFLNTKDLKE